MGLSIIWIFGTNYLVDVYVPQEYTRAVERVKELLYVFVTGLIFYFYILKSRKEKEGILSTLINSMVDAVNFKDGEGRWIEANRYSLNLFELEDVDYKGKTNQELAVLSRMGSNLLNTCEHTDMETWEKGIIHQDEEILVGKDGKPRTFDTIKIPLFNEDGSRLGLVVIGRDISEKKRVKSLLEENKQRYQSLFDYNPDMVYMLDKEGVITNLNPQFETITGYKAEKAMGIPVLKVLPKSIRGEISQLIQSVLNDRKPATFELSARHKNGQALTLHCVSVPMIINNEVSGIIGYAKDLTKIRETEEKLKATEKLSVVGELAASVAHEIRNPLTSLIGFVQLIQMDEEKHKNYFKIMLDELNRINHIVGELLLLAKPQKIHYRQADLHDILHDVISLLRTEASFYNVQIDFSSDNVPAVIECEPNQLKQLFINVIKNAIEASPAGNTVSVRLEAADKEQLAIRIKDNGSGMPREKLDKLGEPFYSSKEKGTGLGLTVSFKIVQAHNGNIQFMSQENSGTEVIIKLPADAGMEDSHLGLHQK